MKKKGLGHFVTLILSPLLGVSKTLNRLENHEKGLQKSFWKITKNNVGETNCSWQVQQLEHLQKYFFLEHFHN